MSKTNNECKEFIVAAIREIRINPTNLKNGTKAGVSINRMWPVIKNEYSREVFICSVNQLLKDKIIILTWRIFHYSSIDMSSSSHRTELVAEIPENTPLVYNIYWRRDDKGKVYTNNVKPGISFDTISCMRLYVASDGLPGKVTKLKNYSNQTLIGNIKRRIKESQ